MNSRKDGRISGGCQCGAVRYSIGRLGRATICHCRMCQKAFGGLFAPLVEAYDIRWTRGERAIFQSSATNWRGYCKDCGTPLTYEYDGWVEVSIGSLDDPRLAPPTVQVNASHQLPSFANLSNLPAKSAEEQATDNEWNGSVQSYQHPDHDT